MVVADEGLDGDRLARELDALFDEPGRLADMGRAAAVLARPGAAGAVAPWWSRAPRASPVALGYPGR